MFYYAKYYAIACYIKLFYVIFMFYSVIWSNIMFYYAKYYAILCYGMLFHVIFVMIYFDD